MVHGLTYRGSTSDTSSGTKQMRAQVDINNISAGGGSPLSFHNGLCSFSFLRSSPPCGCSPSLARLSLVHGGARMWCSLSFLPCSLSSLPCSCSASRADTVSHPLSRTPCSLPSLGPRSHPPSVLLSFALLTRLPPHVYYTTSQHVLQT